MSLFFSLLLVLSYLSIPLLFSVQTNLKSNIQEIIDEVGRSMMMTNLSSSVVDSLDDVEDELNVEFHRLELECKEERQQLQQQRQRPKVEEGDTKEDDKLEPLLLAAVTKQPNDGVSEMSNVCHSQHDCQAKALPV